MHSPAWSNCIFWAVTQIWCYGGYVAFRRSHWGRFPHAMWSPDLKAWYGYAPLSPRTKLCPPPLFRGQVVEEIFYE